MSFNWVKFGAIYIVQGPSGKNVSIELVGERVRESIIR